MRIAQIAIGSGLIAVTMALAACQGTAAVKDAAGKIETFHHLLDAADYQTILKASEPAMQRDSSKAAALFSAIHTKLGNVRESKQVGWRSDFNTSGNFATVTMQTAFEHGSGQETFVYKTDGNDQKLFGYNINSADMMIR